MTERETLLVLVWTGIYALNHNIYMHGRTRRAYCNKFDSSAADGERTYFLLFGNKRGTICLMNMKKNPTVTLWALLAILPIAPVFASFLSVDLEADAIRDRQVYHPGDTVIVAVQVGIPFGYHLYGNPLGPGIGRPLSVWIEGGEEIRWLEARKLPAEKFTPDIGSWVWAYRYRTVIFVKGIVPERNRRTYRGTICIEGLLCKVSCLLTKKKVRFAIPVSGRTADDSPFTEHFDLAQEYARSEPMPLGKPMLGETGPEIQPVSAPMAVPDEEVAWDYDPQERKSKLNLLVALGFGFLAGIVLNFMPCVLPVIGVKLVSLSSSASVSRRESLAGGGAFAAGILTVFLALATLAAFAGYSWGQQFQKPGMLIGIIGLIVIFALGMFDLFQLTPPDFVAGIAGQNRKGLLGDYIKGMVTTVLATPCSGPLLGATLAWTLTQPFWVVYLVFVGIGTGMAVPYVVFSASKTLRKLIPRPGNWMNDMKHAVGFCLLGFALYLMTGLPESRVVPTVSFALVLAVAMTVYGRIAPFGVGIKRKGVAAVVAVLIAAGGGYLTFVFPTLRTSNYRTFAAGESECKWSDFSGRLLLGAHAQGQHVIVNFTASWCMNCQYNTYAVLESKRMQDLFRKKKVVMLRADLTTRNVEAETLLHHLGSRSIPFLALFRGDDPFRPIIMRDVLDKKKLALLLKELPER